MMWTRQQQPHSCSVMVKKFEQLLNSHLWGTERGTVSLVPNGLWKRGQRKRRVCCCQWSWNGFTKQRNDTAGRASRWDVFTNACSGVLAIVLYLAMIQVQSLNVKFHNQLHFKSYMHISGHDEILLCEGPDMIPVDVDSNAFYLQWFAKGDQNSGLYAFFKILSHKTLPNH